jgi:hypothetical protein
MPNCMICKRSAYSGYVICSDCAKTLKADSLSLELEFVLEQLAEEIASSEDIYACPMCERRECSPQVSGPVCRTSVKSWLADKAGKYLAQFSEKECV